MQPLSEKKLSRLLYNSFYHHSQHPDGFFNSKQAAQYIRSNYVVLPISLWNELLPGNKLRWERDQAQALYERALITIQQTKAECEKTIASHNAEYVNGALSALNQEREENAQLRRSADPRVLKQSEKQLVEAQQRNELLAADLDVAARYINALENRMRIEREQAMYEKRLASNQGNMSFWGNELQESLKAYQEVVARNSDEDDVIEEWDDGRDV